MGQAIRNLASGIALLLLATACGQLEKRPAIGGGEGLQAAYSALDGSAVEDSGTVRFNPVEGGHYVIEADDGEVYLPSQLASELQTDGLRVHFAGSLAKDTFSIRMSGRVLTVESIRAE